MMDAVEFLKERRRMCNAQDGCGTCPISIACEDYFVNHKYTRDNTNGMVATVEQWAKEHPIKTRQSVFLEQYPEAGLYADGVLELCPRIVSAACRNDTSLCATHSCDDCRRKFWLAEVEDT